MLKEVIKKLRKSYNYTQKEVADKLGVDRSTYAYYESGRIRPDIDTIRKLSDIFKVHYTQILESEMSGEFKDSQFGVFDLNNQEIELLTIFRMMSDETKKEIIDSLLQKAKRNFMKF